MNDGMKSVSNQTKTQQCMKTVCIASIVWSEESILHNIMCIK